MICNNKSIILSKIHPFSALKNIISIPGLSADDFKSLPYPVQYKPVKPKKKGIPENKRDAFIFS